MGIISSGRTRTDSGHEDLPAPAAFLSRVAAIQRTWFGGDRAKSRITPYVPRIKTHPPAGGSWTRFLLETPLDGFCLLLAPLRAPHTTPVCPWWWCWPAKAAAAQRPRTEVTSQRAHLAQAQADERVRWPMRDPHRTLATTPRDARRPDTPRRRY